MKKYLFITKMVILEKMQYVFNMLGSLISYAILIFIFLNLWKYMYSDTDLIAGYSLKQMSWYLAITEITWFAIRPKKMRRELTEDIKSGKIAYNINKPFHYIWYLLSKYVGETIVSIVVYGISGIIISLIIIGIPDFFTLESIPFILVSLILSSLVTALLYILISLLAFWVEDNDPFFWIYEKFVLIVGIMFPIELFPSYLQPIIKYSPIYSTTYAPTKMFVDFSVEEFLNIIVFQIGYLLILGILCFLVYGKGVKRLSVNGG
jgi:ABC-2 type transport system permease protein